MSDALQPVNGVTIGGSAADQATVLTNGMNFTYQGNTTSYWTVNENGSLTGHDGTLPDGGSTFGAGSVLQSGDTIYDVTQNGLVVHSDGPNEAAFAKEFGTQLTEAGESGSDWAPLLEGANIQALADKHNISLDKGMSLAKGMYGLKKMGAEANAAEWSITRDQIQLGMQAFGMGMALYDKILQNMYMNHRMDLENDMMDLAEDKEANRHELQMTLLEKESTLKDSAMKYDYKTAKLNAGTEKYKAKLAADVKKSKIKQDGIRDLFLRNYYPYGRGYYA